MVKRKDMEGGRGLNGEREEVILKACELCMKANNYNGILENDDPGYLRYEFSPSPSSSEIVIAFDRSWSVSDWHSGSKSFGETKINLDLFPCLRSIGTQDIALVNEAISQRFDSIRSKLEKSVEEGKKIVFTGHSYGGALAILATLWFLNKYRKTNGNTTARCVTFGSPLIGDRIFQHALRRENWARYFIHFVARYDIVPLLTLSPFSSIQQDLPQVLEFLNPKSPQDESFSTSPVASNFFTTVKINASCVASCAASKLMGGTHAPPETFSSFIELSPYRPFGTYIFCNGNEKLIAVENSDAVLQLLFHFSRLSNGAQLASTRLNEHFVYEEVLKGGPSMQDGAYLDHPEATNWSLNGLGLSRRAKLCLRAAEEVEILKKKNQEDLEKKVVAMRKELAKIQRYQTYCKNRKLGYYDSFKLQEEEEDFHANVTRLELTRIWDDFMEKLKDYQLPDEIESQKDWIELGTLHRRLVEPLDVANYYRHGREDDAGAYLKNENDRRAARRPRLYQYTQRWLEHDKKRPFEPMSESCFMAEVEDLRIVGKSKSFEDLKERIKSLERRIVQWDEDEVLSHDVLLERSTFWQWWNSLPEHHKSDSCIAHLFVKT